MSLARNLSRRTLAWGAALLLWVGFVWGHSLVGGAASSAESGRVVALLRPLFEATGVTDLDLMTFVVRKCAHFSEYAVLGGIARTFWTRVSRELGSRASSSRHRVLLAGLVLTDAFMASSIMILPWHSLLYSFSTTSSIVTIAPVLNP